MATKKKVAKKKTGAKKSSVKKKNVVAKKKSSVKKKSTRQNPTGKNRRPTNKEKAAGNMKAKDFRPPTPLTFFTPKKKESFIEFLMEYGVVSYACKEVGISKPTAYSARKRDNNFAEAWDAAIEYSVENMEKVAYERAVNGIDEPLSFKGELTGDSVKRYSDILLMFMIKGNKPEKYRENSKATNINLNLIPNSLSDDQLMRIAQGATIEGETA